jgi:dienelactone hydrolase
MVAAAVGLAGTALAGLGNADAIKPARSLPRTTPWDLKALSRAPAYAWLDRTSHVWSLQYDGLPRSNKPTQVFAYYASPDTLTGRPSGRKFPAVVLVHGGAGTAFPNWAQQWAQRGYAAIAMDLNGKGPAGRLPNGAPELIDVSVWPTIDLPLSEQWSYHAVADVLLAHSLIRGFPEVDRRRTAVTGVSWGGYLTCIAAGLDSRFKAAVPVYGCGFLDDQTVWHDQLCKVMTPAQRQKWMTLWDPSQYVGAARMPMFFINGTGDYFYWLESYAKTYDLVKSPRNFRITVDLPHNYVTPWSLQEIGLFIDQHLTNGVPLPVIGTLHVEEGECRAAVTARTALVAAALHYTADKAPNTARKWKTTPATLEANVIRAAVPPDALIWFLTVTDERQATVSSKLISP